MDEESGTALYFNRDSSFVLFSFGSDNFIHYSNFHGQRVYYALLTFISQLATANGPLAEEPLYGTCFVIEAIDVALPSSFNDLKLKQRLFDCSCNCNVNNSNSYSSGRGAGDLPSSTNSLSSSSMNPAEESVVAEAAAGAAAGGMLGGLHVAKATRLACRVALLSHRYVMKRDSNNVFKTTNTALCRMKLLT